ncbi:MAG: TldD/PmbA family protein [Oscillospiraceae bacterium]|nr:TldD/PmbA family protein [Oscillospiraceae bacterium]
MIQSHILEAALTKALSTGGDYAEVFAENTLSGRLSMLDGKVENALQNRSCGVGVRVFKGLRSVYASSSGLSPEGLLAAAGRAAAAIGEGSCGPEIHLADQIRANIHPILQVGSSVELNRKIEIARTAYAAARDYSTEVSQATVGLLDTDRSILIATSDGVRLTDRQVRTRIAVSAVASNGTETQTGSHAPGASMGYELFDTVDPAGVGAEAARQAVTMLHAGYCPAGRMSVAIDNGFGGVIFHEACGHSLEAESVSRGMSQFSGKLGQQIASSKVTAIDDGTIPNAWGSVNFDDEGTPTERKILIENGILKSYMVDKMGGRRMGIASNGAGRRQSYEYAPTSRMSNTYIAPGTDTDEAIIASIDNGLYAKKMGGGSVNPVTGEFNFAVSEGYLVRNGQICEPVRGASLIGKGSEILMNIDMVGMNLARGQGMCGAASGSIPTDVGQPMIRVSEITVGGRE